MYALYNERYFLAKNVKGQYIPATDPEGCLLFNSQKRAMEALKALPKTIKNAGYHVVSIGDEVKDDDGMQIASSFAPNEIVDAVKHIEDFKEYFSALLKSEADIRDRITKYDRQISDLLHIAEFFNFNVCNGYKIYRRLHDISLLRRAEKNKILIIGAIKDNIPAEQIDRAFDRISSLLERTYKVKEESEFLKEVIDKK